MRVVILGAGFGGLELASLLSLEFGHIADVVLIDKADGFVFGFSKLDVMFGRASRDHVVHPYVDMFLPGGSLRAVCGAHAGSGGQTSDNRPWHL